MAGVVVGEGDDHEARFRQINELKYALRSVYMFAPWIRRIFIATDSPAPEWLADHPSRDDRPQRGVLRRPSVLPTHNSQAVECQLHHIDGLSEHFLYSNDDMFFGRPSDRTCSSRRAASPSSLRRRPGSGSATTTPSAAASRTPPG